MTDPESFSDCYNALCDTIHGYDAQVGISALLFIAAQIVKDTSSVSDTRQMRSLFLDSARVAWSAHYQASEVAYAIEEDTGE